MAVIPEFMPMQAPGTQAGLDLAGENDAQSWMTQAAQRSQIQANTQGTEATTQETQLRSAMFQAQLPALTAKAQADVASAKNEIDSATLQQNLRGEWQSQKPQVVQDIADITDPNNIPKEADGTPDWGAIYNKYENLQAKYASLNLLPEGKPYYNMIDEGKKNAFDMAARHATAQLTLNQLKLASTWKLQNQETMVDKNAATNAAVKPAIAQTEAVNTQRNQAFTDISAKRDSLNQAAFSISQLGDDIEKEDQHPIAEKAAIFLGPGIVGKFGTSGASVAQVASDMGDFANKVMSTVKNLRNFYEYQAVTSNLVKPDQPKEVQHENLAKLQTVNKILGQRNDYQETALRDNPALTPDQADAQAVSKYPFPSSIIAPLVIAKPPSSMSPQDSTALEWAKAHPNDPLSGGILQHISTLP